MKAHWTKFTTDKQLIELLSKATELDSFGEITFEDNAFGFASYENLFVTKHITGLDGYWDYGGQATYLPYTEYLEYLDRCINDIEP